jgi:hypothetical protein
MGTFSYELCTSINASNRPRDVGGRVEDDKFILNLHAKNGRLPCPNLHASLLSVDRQLACRAGPELCTLIEVYLPPSCFLRALEAQVFGAAASRAVPLLYSIPKSPPKSIFLEFSIELLVDFSRFFGERGREIKFLKTVIGQFFSFASRGRHLLVCLRFHFHFESILLIG